MDPQDYAKLFRDQFPSVDDVLAKLKTLPEPRPMPNPQAQPQIWQVTGWERRA